MRQFFCEEIQRWVTENITRPMDTWVNEAVNSCESAPTPINWICSLIVYLVRVVVFIVEAVIRLVAIVVCVVLNVLQIVLDLLAALWNLILSIPVIGAILRNLWNLILDIFWRAAALPDFFLTLAGVMVPKRMFLKVIILNRSGVPLAVEPTVLPLVERAREIFLRECNVELIYKGVCIPQINSPEEALVVNCGEIGLSDFGIGGAYYELVSTDCGFQDGFRRLIGYGADVIAIVIDNLPGTDIGCAAGPTHNYLLLEDTGLAIDTDLLAHEIGHVCSLPDDGNINNLMFGMSTRTNNLLTAVQRATIRTSRHCVLL